jgi:thiamine-monophosphate kinase
MRLANTDGCVVTSDMLNEGTDFVADQCDWRLVGRKALAVNLSDLAAMAAVPLAGIVSLLVPHQDGLQIAKLMYEGLLPLADEFQLPIAGGDTNTWDGPTVICITLIGEATQHGYWTRAGAQPGDWIIVSGRFGGSLLRHQFHFTPRVREALHLNGAYEVHAATDVSDGLSLDLEHITTASRCAADINLDRVPIAPDAQTMAEGDGSSPLERALGDGEDFELILAVPEAEAIRLLDQQPVPVPLTQIGRFVEGDGLWAVDENGQRRRMTATGYRH